METSILTTVKQILGLDENYTAFDQDILMHINTVFANLNQIGVGPALGFYVENKEQKWSDFLGTDMRLGAVPSFVAGKVRLIFDPPSTSFAITALENVLTEMEYRIWTYVEERAYQVKQQSGDLAWQFLDHEGFPVEAEVGDLGYDPTTGNLWRKTDG